MTFNFLRVTSVSLSVMVWATSHGAFAADAATDKNKAEGATVGEVIVTARKTTENLQSIPLSVTAVTAVQLQQAHNVDLADIAKITPGLKYTAFLDSFNGNVTLRGLQQENVANAVGNVGTFLDGIYLQRGYMVDATLGDIERVEVVKGPQSALYGENTFAGAVNIVLRQPTDTYTANGSFTAGNGGLLEERLGVGGPIIKGILDGRAFVGQSDYDGVWPNGFPGATGSAAHLGGHKDTNYSFGLKFTPTNRLTINAEFYSLRRHQDIGPFYTLDGDSPLDKLNCGAPTATGGYSLWCGNLPTNPASFRSGVGNPPPGLVVAPQPGTQMYTRMWKASAAYRLTDDVQLSYTYGNVKGSALEQADFSTDSYNPGSPVVAVQREGGLLTYSSHEVRLAYNGSFPLKGEIGYFHSNASDTEAFGLNFALAGVALQPGPSDPTSLGGVLVPFNHQINSYTTDSPFGRLTYSFLGDKFTASAELRYNHIKLVDEDLLALAGNPNLPLLRASYGDFTPRFTVQYKPAQDELVYLSAARGDKAGGFNGYVAGSLTLLPDQQAFGAESNWTYEAGWKATLLDHTLVVNADVFYVNWTNKQEAVEPSNYVEVNSQSQGVVPQIYENVGNAYSYGFELDSHWKPIPPLTLNLDLSLQNPRYAAGSKALPYLPVCDNVVCKANGDVGGNEIAQVSQVSFDVGGNYRWSYRSIDYVFGVDESYRGFQYADDVNVAKFPAYFTTDAHFTVSHGALSASLWAKNLFNKVYLDAAFVIPSIYQYNVNFGELRTYGITLAVNY